MTSHAPPVLVATDLGARSDRAVDRACLLAQAWGATLKVFHAVEPGSWADRNPAFAIGAVRAVLPDPSAAADILLAHEPAPQAIVRSAQETGCGLIVAGVARLNQVGDFLIGTTVDHAVRNAAVPVLVVKQRVHGAYRSLLVTTDFSSCSRLALTTAANMFPDAALHVLHVYDVPLDGWPGSNGKRPDLEEQAQRELEAFVDHPDLSQTMRSRISIHLGHGVMDNVVEQTAREVHSDLLVLGTHGKTGFLDFIVGSRAESLLFWSRTDTLMVRESP
jgi:nucleotide-binding universal stress UspA family protein